MIKKILKILGIIILLILIIAVAFFWNDATSNKYDVTIDESSIPKFNEVNLPFVHKYNKKKSLPIAPSALIDINNDQVDEVFFGGGMGQEDALLAFRNGVFVTISSEVNLPKKAENMTSIGVVSADFNNNGFVDLLIGREDGLHLYYNDNGKFSETKIETPMNTKSTPSGFTVGDIDKDGDLDVFLATYIKKDSMQGQTKFEDYTYGSTSELLLNNGDNTFKRITEEAGLNYIHNTFQGVFVDIDNDSWLDLVVAHDTGEVRTYKNNGDLTFTMKENPLTKKFAYPMGIAVGDYNNDGLVDFMFSNTGSTLPKFIAKGDIKDASKFNEKWLLFENEGGFKFKDVAEKTKIADYEFSWGCVFADMNNDGLQDLIVAENYVDLAPNKLFRLSGRFLIQKKDHTFVPTEKQSGVVNPHFGITPLVSDFNKDGYLDLIYTNINTPSMAFINNGGINNYLQVNLGDNAKTQGAVVTLKTPNKTLTEYLVSGEGLASDQSAIIHFGLGKDTQVLSLSIKYANDETLQITNLKPNTLVDVEKERIGLGAKKLDSITNSHAK